MPATDADISRHADMKGRALRQFEGWAESYDRSVLHHFLFRPGYLALMEEIARWYDQRCRPFRLLDIGCGTGELAGLVSRSCWPVRIVGIDYAPAMCARARTKAAASPPTVLPRFAAGDSEFLPFADNSFDMITCSNSFHHYPHQAEVIRQVHRLLAAGGRFILIDGFRDNVIGWVTFDVIVDRIEGNVHHAPWSLIDRYFRDAGFVNTRRRKVNFWMPLCITIGDASK